MDIALPVILFVVGFAAGGSAIWYICRKLAEERVRDKDVTIAELQTTVSMREHQLKQQDEANHQLSESNTKLQMTLEKEEEKIEEKIQLLTEAEKQFKDAFRALAADALNENTKRFDKLYSGPVKTTLENIKSKIELVESSATNLGVKTSNLVMAFQKPEFRGQWGEMAMERVLELAGLSEGRDFTRQQVIGEDAQLRPDIVIHLPGDKHLAIDAKAPIRSVLEAAEASDEEEREQKLTEFAAHVRGHVKSLSAKSYALNLDNSPEFVVLYLPSEAIYCKALSLDIELLEYAYGRKVIVAGPTILISLLLAVAHGWKQETLAKHAKDICTLGTDLYSRLAVFGDHMSNVGNHLHRSVKAYNEAVGSLESRVMPSARKFEQFGAAPANAQLEELTAIDTVPRKLQSPDFRVVEADGEVEDQESLARPR